MQISIKDRLNTRNLLRRKNVYLDDYTCVLCSNGLEETSFHLFFECSFSVDCWSINIQWNLNLQPLDMVITTRNAFGKLTFRELVITACWIIWEKRNGIIFDGERCSLSKWKNDLKKELALVCMKAKRGRKVDLNYGARISLS